MLRVLALAASAVLIAACEPAGQSSVTITTGPVVLFPDDPGRERIGALRYTGGLALTSDNERFGGWSAMELSEDGTRLLAISDSASWMTASLSFDNQGQLSGLTDMALAPMLDRDGRALGGEAADAEGLAPLGGGAYAVSFERQHRLERYDIGSDWSAIETATATTLPEPPGADRLRNNAGIEALAVSADALWAGIEYPIVEGRPHTLWRIDMSSTSANPVSRTLTLTPGFGLTALTGDGQGGLFVVERFFARNVGNRIRVGHVGTEALAVDNGPLVPTHLAEISPDMTVDNFEAIAVAQVDSETRLFLLSDDNFNDAQRTLLLSFVIEAD